MNLDTQQAFDLGARVGYRDAGTVFFANFSHVEQDGTYALLDSDGWFVYITDEEIEEVEYNDPEPDWSEHSKEDEEPADFEEYHYERDAWEDRRYAE